MKVQIQKITPKTLFKIVFAGYLLGGMHFTMHHPGGYGLYLPFNTVGWMFISALIGIGFWQIAISEKIIFTRFHIFCWIGFGLMCLPLLYQNNENSGLALHRFLGLGGGFLLYLSFQQFHFNSKDRHWFLYIILAGILIQTFYGVAQHFLHLESWFGISVDRPFGVLMQKNVMATFLVTGAAISLFLLIDDDVIMQSNLKKRIVYLTPVLTSILYIPLNSRAGYLSFTIAIGLLLMLGNKKKKQVRTWIGLALIGLLIGSRTTDTISHHFALFCPTLNEQKKDSMKVTQYQLISLMGICLLGLTGFSPGLAAGADPTIVMKKMDVAPDAYPGRKKLMADLISRLGKSERGGKRTRNPLASQG